MKLDTYRLYLTKHAYRRYCQRVNFCRHRTLIDRCQTAVQCGLYRFDGSRIRIYGAWWAYSADHGKLILITCYGKQIEPAGASRRGSI